MLSHLAQPCAAAWRSARHNGSGLVGRPVMPKVHGFANSADDAKFYRPSHDLKTKLDGPLRYGSATALSMVVVVNSVIFVISCAQTLYFSVKVSPRNHHSPVSFCTPCALLTTVCGGIPTSQNSAALLWLRSPFFDMASRRPQYTSICGLDSQGPQFPQPS